MRSRLIWMLLPLALASVLVACSDDDTIDPEAAGATGDVIDREVILGNIEDVRALIADNAPSLDPMIVSEVDYSDGTLSVTLAESQNSLDTSGLESTCEEISNAIALPDVGVTIEKADGSESVECEFSA